MKRLRSACAVLLLALAASFAFAQTQPAPPATPALQPGHEVTADGRHTLNLKDADIQALIATVSEITGKNFIVGPNVQGKVTVVSAKPMRPDEIYDVFLSVLHVHGFAAVPSGSMVKILPEALAQTEATTAQVERAPDELVTQIVPVKHVSAAELVPILRPLMPQGGQILAHASSNSLIISDRAAQRAAARRDHPAHRYLGRRRGRSDPADARELGRDCAHPDAPDRRQDRAAGRSVARLRRYAHELDPDLGREGGAAEAPCARRASRFADRQRRRHAGDLPSLCEREGSRADFAGHRRDADRHRPADRSQGRRESRAHRRRRSRHTSRTMR